MGTPSPDRRGPTHLLRAVVLVISQKPADSRRPQPDSASCLSGPVGTSMFLRPVHLCLLRLALGALATSYSFASKKHHWEPKFLWERLFFDQSHIVIASVSEAI